MLSISVLPYLKKRIPIIAMIILLGILLLRAQAQAGLICCPITSDTTLSDPLDMNPMDEFWAWIFGAW